MESLLIHYSVHVSATTTITNTKTREEIIKDVYI